MPKQTAVNRRIILYYLLALSTVTIISAGLWCGYYKGVKPLPVDPQFTAFVINDINEPDAKGSIESALQSGRAFRLNIAGCPNLYQVSDTLYRGAQPDRNGFENLKKLGIKTVVNLRSLHSDQELLSGLGIRYISIPINTWDVLEEQVLEFLRIVKQADASPVFVHCQHGADRTGTMIAAYRIVEQNWEKERAIREMTYGGYNYHPLWKGLPNFLNNLDIESIRRKLNQ